MGFYVARRCLEQGWHVMGVDKMTYAANPDLLERLQSYPKFKFIKQDIADLDHLYDCDYVINTAAESHVDNSINNPQNFINTNILGTYNLLLETQKLHQKNHRAQGLNLQSLLRL